MLLLENIKNPLISASWRDFEENFNPKLKGIETCKLWDLKILLRSMNSKRAQIFASKGNIGKNIINAYMMIEAFTGYLI